MQTERRKRERAREQYLAWAWKTLCAAPACSRAWKGATSGDLWLKYAATASTGSRQPKRAPYLR